ncbi:MAG: DNA glycosylase [Verrucomicrobiales bacterium]|nr:DNA glycosylase [Verrucomicrobiales bacterium]
MTAKTTTLSVDYCFDLAETLNSGQVFHWEEHCFGGIDGFAGCIGEAPPVWIAQTGESEITTLRGAEDLVSEYLGLDQPIDQIHSSFPQNDEFLDLSISFCPGLRLIRQPMWECLATFITSSLKQVAHIRAISLTLRERYGVAHQWDGKVFYSYPTPLAIAEAGEEALRKCSLGYRAKSLQLAGQMISSGEIDLEGLPEMTTEQAVAELTRLHGVGDKIAHCALLFGGGRWEMFPIDVWIERVLRKPYRKRVKGVKLQKWAMKYFGPNAGYAQQYLFHFARKSVSVND